MNVIEVTNRIKNIDLFKDLCLNEPTETSHYGIINVPYRNIKDSNKNELILGLTYQLFVAHMYEDDDKMEEFFYLTFYREAQQRDYRRRSFYQIEYNKIFASGNSVEAILNDFESKLINYSLK